MSRKLWSREDLAAWLGVSKKTTYEMQKAGAIPPPLRIGMGRGTSRWDAAEVEAWVKAKAS